MIKTHYLMNINELDILDLKYNKKKQEIKKDIKAYRLID